MSSRRDKVTRELIDRYKLIRAVHTCYYIQLDRDIQQVAPEFFYLVNDILEGKPIDESRLRHIDMRRVDEFLREDK